MNRIQQDVIDYLQEENQTLREQLVGRRLRFTDSHRSRLAERAKKLGRRKLLEIGALVTPDTLLRWYRELIAQKYDGRQKGKPVRSQRPADIEQLILEMARGNSRWATPESSGRSTIWDTKSAESPSSAC